MDLHEALRALHGDFLSGVTDQPVEPVVAAARRRRNLTRARYGAVGTAAVLAIVVSGTALANQPTPLPPATATPAPAPANSTPPAPTPTPTELAWSPNLAQCGTSGSTWNSTYMNQPDASAQVRDRSWADPADSSVDSWVTLSTAAWDEDHNGSALTVEVLDAVVMTAPAYSHEGNPPPGDVLAVLGEEIDPFDVEIVSGAEGGEGGSLADIETQFSLALCDDATALPDGVYVTVTRYQLTLDGQSEVVYGMSKHLVGEVSGLDGEAPELGGEEPKAPSIVSTLNLAPQLDMPSETYQLDMGRCGKPTDDLDAIVTADPVLVGKGHFDVNGGYGYGFLPYRSGQQRLVEPGYSGWMGEPSLGYWPDFETSELTILDAVVASTTPGTKPIWKRGEYVVSGPVIGLLSGPVTPWQRPSGPLTLSLPLTWCDGSTTVPDGQLAVYVKVQENVSGTDDEPWATTGVYWIPMLFAVGEDAWGNDSTWPY